MGTSGVGAFYILPATHRVVFYRTIGLMGCFYSKGLKLKNPRLDARAVIIGKMILAQI